MNSGTLGLSRLVAPHTRMATTKLVDSTPAQKQAANLTILQRKDEAISEILATATYVVLYLFDDVSKEWTRKEVEGSLFIVKRSFGCRFRLIILNRLSNQDLLEDLTSALSLEEMDPYLLYRTTSPETGKVETHAIWFHDPKERSAMHACLRRVLRSQANVVQLEKKEGSRPAAPAKATQQQQSSVAATAASRGTPSPGATQQPAQQQLGADGGAAPITLKDLLFKGAAPSTAANGSSATKPTAFVTTYATPQGGASADEGSSTDAVTPLLQQLLLKPSAAPTTAVPPQPPSGLLAMLRQPPATTAPAPTGGVVLDKQQLKATLLELIEDDAFIETLHGAYLARLRRGSPRAEEQGGQQADA